MLNATEMEIGKGLKNVVTIPLVSGSRSVWTDPSCGTRFSGNTGT